MIPEGHDEVSSSRDHGIEENDVGIGNVLREAIEKKLKIYQSD